MKHRTALVLLALLLALAAAMGCTSAPAAEPTPTTAGQTKTPRPTFTSAPTVTDTPAATATPTTAPTATPEPTSTPEPTGIPTATRVPPTPKPQPTDPPAPQAGAHGVLGRVRLRENRTEYGVGEQVFIVFTAENHTAGDIPFGILGLKASNGQFQTSWTSDVYSWSIPANGVFERDDHVKFSEPGTYNIKLAICFSQFGDCQGGGADWEEFGPGVTVTIR